MIAFEDEQGRQRSLADFRGRVVLLNIWATWCLPCRREMPSLDRLQATLGEPDFEVVALSIDRSGIDAVRKFYAEVGIRNLAIHIDGSANAARDLGAIGIPATLLIDRQGREIGRLMGPAEWDEPGIVEFLKRVVAQKASAAEVKVRGAATLTTAAWAHSLKELETMLGDREKYFQTIDKPAPDFALQDADGWPLGHSDLRGKVIVLHFIYASCPDVCPLHADRIAELQAMINQTPMKEQVQFVTITTDPRNDTPDVLRAYGGQHGLDPINWVFLTSREGQPEDATRRLAERFGHKFTKTEEGYQVHSIVTHVIDREGRWRANFHSLKFEPSSLVVFVNALVNDVHKAHREGERGYWERLKSLFGL